MKELKIKRLMPDAILPTRATAGSAGYDLYACLDGDIQLLPGETVFVHTGIAIALPSPGYVAYIFARSSLGIKHGIVPANCVAVIDSDYRGEILVGLFNHSRETFVIHPRDRIAQMVISPVLTPELAEVDELDETVRNTCGFGSTGRG